MIGTAACQRVDVAMIIFESLLVILQQRDILLEAIASLLWIRGQGSHLPLSQKMLPLRAFTSISWGTVGDTLFMMWVRPKVLRRGHGRRMTSTVVGTVVWV